MAGHSKWNNIKNRKGAADIQRAKIFADIAKMIRVAVKSSGIGDPKSNPSLRLALDKARAANMPNDKIQRAIDAGLGKRNGQAIQEIVYEGFGPGGVALMIAAMTDNTQRTSSEMKFILSRNGGSLGSPGSAAFMFTRHPDGSYTPAMPMEITDENTIEHIESLLEALHGNDDVEDVYVSATWSE
jgi:YebC/PmpR family DNA-binding regulatory protein